MLSDTSDKILTNLTTYQLDYKRYDGFKRASYNYQQERYEKPPKSTPAAIPTNHETFAPWKKGVRVPFDLLLTPKEIVHTHPNTKILKVTSVLEEQTEEIIKTRPRVYMAPACCLDDVPDSKMRKLLIEQTYTTEWRKAEKETTEKFRPVEPCIAEIGQKDNVKLEIDYYKPLDERFRIRGKKWDDDQPRGECDPTRDFWINKDPPVICGACVDPFKGIVSDKIKDTIKSLIATETLRFPHDKLSPSYAGYKPLLPMGITLSKSRRSITHPLLSTYQAVNEREKLLKD